VQKTYKLYYKDPFLSSCDAKVIEIDEKGIVLGKTVAYPEGGGQEGDSGLLIINNKEINFTDTQKGVGRVLFLENFPTVSVDNLIYHKICKDDIKYFKLGDSIKLKIDINRRAKLTASHTATHLMLMAIEELYGKYEDRVYGCHIKNSSARLDFKTSQKFLASDIEKIENLCNSYIEQNLDIKTYPHPQEQEALYWECKGVVYPCGGTHLANTKYLKSISIRKKNLGKNAQRVALDFEIDSSLLSCYHD